MERMSENAVLKTKIKGLAQRMQQNYKLQNKSSHKLLSFLTLPKRDANPNGAALQLESFCILLIRDIQGNEAKQLAYLHSGPSTTNGTVITSLPVKKFRVLVRSMTIFVMETVICSTSMVMKLFLPHNVIIII